MAGKSGQGTLILVLGILGFIGCGIITAIPAWIMGNNALKAIDSGEGDPNERQLVQVGHVGPVTLCLQQRLKTRWADHKR